MSKIVMYWKNVHWMTIISNENILWTVINNYKIFLTRIVIIDDDEISCS